MIRGRSRPFVAAAVVALAVLCVGAALALRPHGQDPSCPGGPVAPITVDRARDGLARRGFDTHRVQRSELCADKAVAVLSTGDSVRGGTRLTCALRSTPIFHPTSVSEQPRTDDGAVHLVVRNVECFLYSPLGRTEALRTALASLCPEAAQGNPFLSCGRQSRASS